jgi:hypothetical protein
LNGVLVPVPTVIVSPSIDKNGDLADLDFNYVMFSGEAVAPSGGCPTGVEGSGL